MSLHVRRVVTGHDQHGRAVVKLDEISMNMVSKRPGSTSCVIWTTEGFPVDNDEFVDTSKTPVGTSIPGGTVFRVVRYDPAVSPRRHRSDSTDYAVVISGQIEMELDSEVVQLSAGDMVVQRGTMHNWVNRGPDPCVIAFILIDAKPVTVAGQTLPAEG